jgi:hypothetical protein
LGAYPNIDGKIILLAMLTIVFTEVSSKFNSVIVDVVVALFLLAYTAVGQQL